MKSTIFMEYVLNRDYRVKPDNDNSPSSSCLTQSSTLKTFYLLTFYLVIPTFLLKSLIKIKGFLVADSNGTVENSNNTKDNLVKKTCKELGITQKELAERIGVSNNTISSWKNFKQPMPKWAYKLLSFVQIEQDYRMLKLLLNKNL